MWGVLSDGGSSGQPSPDRLALRTERGVPWSAPPPSRHQNDSAEFFAILARAFRNPFASLPRSFPGPPASRMGGRIVQRASFWGSRIVRGRLTGLVEGAGRHESGMNAALFAAHSASLFAALFGQPNPAARVVVEGGVCGRPRHPLVRPIAVRLARMPDARSDAPRTPQ